MLGRGVSYLLSVLHWEFVSPCISTRKLIINAIFIQFYWIFVMNEFSWYYVPCWMNTDNLISLPILTEERWKSIFTKNNKKEISCFLHINFALMIMDGYQLIQERSTRHGVIMFLKSQMYERTVFLSPSQVWCRNKEVSWQACLWPKWQAVYSVTAGSSRRWQN